MPLIYIDQETKDLIDQHQDVIKDVYITNKLFIDSVVRSRLRWMNYEVGTELVVRHIKYLEQKQRLNKERLKYRRLLKRHKARIDRAIALLNNPKA